MDFCSRNQLFAPGDRVLTGVSGGADSVCLLLFLCSMRMEQDLKVAAVHVNHGIRGTEAEQDENFTRALCSRLGSPSLYIRLISPRIAAERSMSLEGGGPGGTIPPVTGSQGTPPGTL